MVKIDGGTEMPHPNADLLRKGYDAFSKGDLDTIRNEVFSPDVVFHVAGRNPLSGDYRGADEVFGFFGRLFELSGGTLVLELHDVVANDGHAVGLSRLSAQREGKTLDGANGVEVYHVQDGRVTEAWLTTEDNYSFDEFWS
ncbi:MAG: nuclear transport factor 2 family protein [Actinobacteria bacterium]|nr:nuclear transport factor 2 family protein [Actinomycetota bacterium]